MAKKKYYVVWEGREKGIYDKWEDCKEQIDGFANAKYKSFATRELAEEAFGGLYNDFVGTKTEKPPLSEEALVLIGKPILNSISVDGAWSNTTGLVEYQGVYTDTGTNLFRVGPYEDGTNNIVEFLAIVHALAYCKKHKLDLPIYSDSRNAIKWVKNKEVKTNRQRNSKNQTLFELIDRAVKWLHENSYSNKILKWETKAWGEIPADFGRK